MSGVATMLPFDDWQADCGQVDASPVLAVPELSTEGSDVSAHDAAERIMPGTVRVGGQAAVEPRTPTVGYGESSDGDGSPCAVVDDRQGVLSPDAWGRVQAARAPRWSARQRAHAAGMFGLSLPATGRRADDGGS